MSGTVSEEFAKGDGYVRLKFMMERAHESLLLGLDSVMKQAEAGDHSADIHNWLGYVGAWASCVHHHHSIEELELFPLFEKKGIDVHGELDAHKKLHADLDRLQSSLTSWRSDPSSYSSSALRAQLSELAPNFRAHLHDEVEGLARERLAPRVSSEELNDCIARLEAQAKKGDPFVDPVFMMSHTPPQHKYWSNMGWFMYKVLIPALSYRHAGYWKYAPEPLNI